MKNKTLRISIFSIITLILIWGAYFYAIHYINSSLASFGEVKNKIQVLTKKAESARKLREQVQLNSSGSFNLDAFIIHPEETADIVQNLESIGPSTGTKIVTQTVSIESGVGLPEGADFLRLGFLVTGQKQNVLNCIRLFEHLPYNTKINKLSFSKISGASSTVAWSATVDLVIVKLIDSSQATENKTQ
jgi:hypothetical protein